MPRKAKKTAEDYTRAELYARAERKGIKYRSRMNKQQLFEALGLGKTRKKSAAKAKKKTASARSAARKTKTGKKAPAKTATRAAKKSPTRKTVAKKKAAPAERKTAARKSPAKTAKKSPAKKKPVAKPRAKAKVKATAKRRKPVRRAKAASATRKVRTPARLEPVVAAEKSLPSNSVVPPPPPAAAAAAYIDRGPALPESYGDDRIVALVRDPRCIFAYWELSGGGYERIRGDVGEELNGGVWVLRLIKVAGERFFDVPIDPGIGNWYLHVEPSERYQVKIGVVLPSGAFRELAASPEVVTPSEQVSDVIDEEWMLVREEFDRLVEQILAARVPGGVGSSEILHRLMSLPRRMELFSGSITSPRGGR